MLSAVKAYLKILVSKWGRLGDCLTHSRAVKRKSAEIPFHQHRRIPLHGNSMLSGEICGVACWLTFTLRAFSFGFSFFLLPSTPTQRPTWNWTKHRRKHFQRKEKSMAFYRFRIFLPSSEFRSGKTLVHRAMHPKCFPQWNANPPNWKTFDDTFRKCFFGDFLSALHNGDVEGELLMQLKRFSIIHVGIPSGKIFSDFLHVTARVWNLSKKER